MTSSSKVGLWPAILFFGRHAGKALPRMIGIVSEATGGASTVFSGVSIIATLMIGVGPGLVIIANSFLPTVPLVGWFSGHIVELGVLFAVNAYCIAFLSGVWDDVGTMVVARQSEVVRSVLVRAPATRVAKTYFDVNYAGDIETTFTVNVSVTNPRQTPASCYVDLALASEASAPRWLGKPRLIDAAAAKVTAIECSWTAMVTQADTAALVKNERYLLRIVDAIPPDAAPLEFAIPGRSEF